MASDVSMSLIDISQPLAPTTAVWPGDRDVTWTWSAQIDDTSPVNVGALTTSVHAGTHADAPLHVDADGAAIDEVSLDAYIGPAQVIAVDTERIRTEHVARMEAPRVLFKTAYANVPHTEWAPDALAPIEPAAVHALAEQDAVLVGTDAPSVDPVDSKTLPAHHALNRSGIAILENLALRGVAPGRYELLACPLRVRGGDAAPVRAVLRASTADHAA